MWRTGGLRVDGEERGEDKNDGKRDEPGGSARGGTSDESGDGSWERDDAGLLDVREAGHEQLGDFGRGRESSAGGLRVQLGDDRFEPIRHGGIDLAERAGVFER